VPDEGTAVRKAEQVHVSSLGHVHDVWRGDGGRDCWCEIWKTDVVEEDEKKWLNIRGSTKISIRLRISEGD
jgi:hypothetical protein